MHAFKRQHTFGARIKTVIIIIISRDESLRDRKITTRRRGHGTEHFVRAVSGVCVCSRTNAEYRREANAYELFLDRGSAVCRRKTVVIFHRAVRLREKSRRRRPSVRPSVGLCLSRTSSRKPFCLSYPRHSFDRRDPRPPFRTRSRTGFPRFSIPTPEFRFENYVLSATRVRAKTVIITLHVFFSLLSVRDTT